MVAIIFVFFINSPYVGTVYFEKSGAIFGCLFEKIIFVV